LDSLLLTKSTPAYLVGHWHIEEEEIKPGMASVRDGFCEVAAERNGKLSVT